MDLRVNRQVLPFTVMAAAAALVLSGCSVNDAVNDTVVPEEAAASGEIELLTLNEDLAAQVPEEFRGRTLMYGAGDDAPYNIISSKGDIDGLVPDLFEQIESILDIEVEFTPTKFDAAIPGIQSGRIDFAGPAGDFLERQEIVDLSDFAQSNVTLLVDAAGDYAPTQSTDMCGVKVGLEKGAASQNVTDAIDALCQEAGLDPVDTQTYPDSPASILALKSGRIDASLAPTAVNSVAANESDGALEVIEIDDMIGLPAASATYAILSQKDSGLAQAITGALQYMEKEGVYTQLFEKWGVPLSAISADRLKVNGSTQSQAA